MQANEYKSTSVDKVRKLANCTQYDKQHILDVISGAINATVFTGQSSPTIRPMTEEPTYPSTSLMTMTSLTASHKQVNPWEPSNIFGTIYTRT